MKAPHNEIITLDSYSTVDTTILLLLLFISQEDRIQSSVPGIIHQTSCDRYVTFFFFFALKCNLCSDC